MLERNIGERMKTSERSAASRKEFKGKKQYVGKVGFGEDKDIEHGRAFN